MAAHYLDWLADVFEEAQVPFTPANAAWLDGAVRRIAGVEAGAPEEAVYRRVRERWLNHGQPGRQLLAAFLRDEAYARRDSPLRPVEGGAFFTNDWAASHPPPK